MGGKRPRRRFSDEFKRDAVEIVRSSGKPIRQVADELGIYDSTWSSPCWPDIPTVSACQIHP